MISSFHADVGLILRRYNTALEGTLGPSAGAIIWASGRALSALPGVML